MKEPSPSFAQRIAEALVALQISIAKTLERKELTFLKALPKTPQEIKQQEQEAVTTFMKAMQESHFDDFVAFITNPKKLFFINFLIGIARGFGTLVGATIVFALAGWMITQIVDFPLIGKYFSNVERQLEELKESTNAVPHLKKIEAELKAIKEKLPDSN